MVARRSFGILHVPPAITGFRAACPRVEVDLVLTEAMDLTLADGVDVMIRLGRPTERSVVATRRASGRRVLCASPAYLARLPPLADPEDLEQHNCLAYRCEYEPVLWVFETEGQRREVTVAGPLRSNSGEVLRRAALDSLGFALLPEWIVADDLAAGLLRACLPGLRAYPAGYQAEIYAVHARQEVTPAKVAAFISHLSQCVGKAHAG